MGELRNIPTNVITGFLGAGKSTVVMNLLAQKPADERWAVLVNEFGEVGIDGKLIAGSASGSGGVYVREVAGGCMCCAAGIPMQMAMRMLLSRAKPSRLLIEPTGLGHPMEVLEMLQSAYYRDILDLRSTVTLVDARKISDTRYASHETFNQQIDIADVIVASKADLYGDTETRALRNHLDARGWSGNQVTSANGSLPLDTLSPKSTRGVLAQAQDREHEHDSQPLTELQTPMAEPPLTFPPEGYLRLENRDPTFSSAGWLFRPDFVFRYSAITSLLGTMHAERIKALVRTDRGDFGYNAASDVLTEVPLTDLDDSRIEVIVREHFDAAAFENALLAAVCTKT